MPLTEKKAPRNMTEDDWKEIIASIEREECILVLGPGAVRDKDENSLQEKLAGLLAGELQIPMPTEHDQLFSLCDRIMQKRGWRKVLSDHVHTAFRVENPHPMYGQLAKIPIHFYVSLSPDHLLKDAFESQQLPHQFVYYNYKSNPEFEGVPERNMPLVLNLFGSMDDEDSLVMTHDSLFDFLFSILSTKRLPLQVKEKILSAYNFVLLGFDFESWYLKILLRLFESHRKEISYANSWYPDRLTEGTRSFFEQKFKVDFVVEEIPLFIDQLYERCVKGGLIREGGKEDGQPETLYNRVVAYIKQSKVDEAIDILDKQAMEKGDNDLFTQIVMMSRRYNGLISSQTKGILKREDAELELNQIVNSLMSIAGTMTEDGN